MSNADHDYMTKPTRVKAIRFGGGASDAVEVVRWLTKWDFDVEYRSETAKHDERISGYAPGDFEPFDLYANQWLVWFPHSENEDEIHPIVFTDDEFKNRFQK